MKLQTIVAAVALVAAGAANASLQNIASGNSSLAFIAFDTVTTGANPAVGSVFVDLGFEINSFDPVLGNNFSAVNTKIVWNFGANTITVNGNLVNATNDFSAFGSFIAANGADAKWAVIGGDLVSDAQRVLTTGTPNATQLAAENSSATAGASGLVDNLYNNAGVSSSVDNGSYFASSAADFAYVARGDNFGTNWQNKLKWQSATANAQNNFTMALGDGTEEFIGVAPADADTTGLLNGKGTFTFDKEAGTLTWATGVTAAVPEPSTYALALVGLAALGAMARRRSTK